MVDSNTLPAKITTTLYVGNAVYVNDTLQFFATGEGRARVNTGNEGWIYDYFLKNHLGNTRMMITDDYNVSRPILEASSYYPFGLKQKGIGLTAGSPLHNYKNTFQKQEFNEDLGIDLYGFKYRMDDPQIGRFWQVDPMADKYVYNSTYAFSENHLTGHIELEGLEKISINDVLNRPLLAIEYLLQPEVYVNAARTFNDLVGTNNAIELFTGKRSLQNSRTGIPDGLLPTKRIIVSRSIDSIVFLFDAKILRWYGSNRTLSNK